MQTYAAFGGGHQKRDLFASPLSMIYTVAIAIVGVVGITTALTSAASSAIVSIAIHSVALLWMKFIDVLAWKY